MWGVVQGGQARLGAQSPGGLVISVPECGGVLRHTRVFRGCAVCNCVSFHS